MSNICSIFNKHHIDYGMTEDLQSYFFNDFIIETEKFRRRFHKSCPAFIPFNVWPDHQEDEDTIVQIFKDINVDGFFDRDIVGTKRAFFIKSVEDLNLLRLLYDTKDLLIVDEHLIKREKLFPKKKL